jgi:hypothetical protein
VQRKRSLTSDLYRRAAQLKNRVVRGRGKKVSTQRRSPVVLVAGTPLANSDVAAALSGGCGAVSRFVQSCDA